jgi:CarD family transcriptional regulator
MTAPKKTKKTTRSKTKKPGPASGLKQKSKRNIKSASSSSPRSRATKSKLASNTRAAPKAAKTVRAKAKTVGSKLAKGRSASSAETKKSVSAARRKALALKSANKTSGTAAAAKRASKVGAPLKEQEAKLLKANRSAPEIRAAANKAPPPLSAVKPNSAPPVQTPSPLAATPVKAAPSPVKAAKVDETPAAAKALKTASQRQGFKLNEFVVYPAHGVGQVVAIEEQEVAGFKLELFVISFSKDKLTLRVPTSKVAGVGMRKISDPDTAKRSLDILTGRARVKRTMWSRRAQEYETKINSGDINAIAEVVRDLYRSEAQPEQSYSERQLYEAALDRMVREIAAVQKSNEIDALKAVEAQLQKGQSRAAKALPAPSAASEIEQAA